MLQSSFLLSACSGNCERGGGESMGVAGRVWIYGLNLGSGCCALGDRWRADTGCGTDKLLGHRNTRQNVREQIIVS